LRSSFLPGRDEVRRKLIEYSMEELDLSKGAVLEQNRPYLIPLRERLALPEGIRARANPRSSTGRLDIFTRLLVDRGNHFDDIPAGYEGELFLEVVPRSYTVKVHEGTRLNQLRLLAGEPGVDDGDLEKAHSKTPIVFSSASIGPEEEAWISGGLFLSVDLSMKKRLQFVGYRAKKSSALIDLKLFRTYEISDFWERVSADRRGRLILEPEEFYLLVSRERVRIPGQFAAEMSAYDPTSGELRTHYAGFFDPGFGQVSGTDTPGTAAVLEVRAHDVAFALEHGQRICKLTFERMQAEPDRLYGSVEGPSYQRQYLALGRQFKTNAAADMRTRPDTIFEEGPLKVRLVAAGTDNTPQDTAA
jgi:dCTP deaminase